MHRLVVKLRINSTVGAGPFLGGSRHFHFSVDNVHPGNVD